MTSLQDLSVLGWIVLLVGAAAVWVLFSNKTNLAMKAIAFAVCCGVAVLFAGPPRHRSFPNGEHAAITDIRALQESQTAYARVNQGAYGPPDCLADPIKCGLPSGTPAFLEAAVIGDKGGYKRVFLPWVTPGLQPGQRLASNSLTRFAIVAVPLMVGQTGNRAFCGDDSGAICVTVDGSPPRVREGRCVPCNPLK